jgi:hypothetical protein
VPILRGVERIAQKRGVLDLKRKKMREARNKDPATQRLKGEWLGKKLKLHPWLRVKVQ